jgi:hypothetical protein
LRDHTLQLLELMLLPHHHQHPSSSSRLQPSLQLRPLIHIAAWQQLLLLLLLLLFLF